MEFKYCVILACLVLAVFLVVKEIKRQDKSSLIGRLSASLVMVMCFALLIIPFQYTIKIEEPIAELNFYTEKTNPFVDLNYHLKAHPEIQKINIYGYGLSADELKKLRDYQLIFHPSDIPSGFTSASWPKKIKATEQLTIQGSYQNSTNKAVKVKFLGLGVSFDSVLVKANSKTNFSFNSSPKQIGKAVFSLLALNGKDTLAAEPVPFEVEPAKSIRVLILASFPDFEYKFLKKWLFENQFQVAFRTQISKDKYSTEFLNRKPTNLTQLNPTMLKDIDVAIIDEEEYKPALSSAVSAGMGLIVRAKIIKPIQNHQPLLADTAGKVSVDSKLMGMGKVITTTILSTYQWQLAGKGKDYSQFWSLLVEKALRKKIENYTYTVEPQWPSIDEKMKLSVNLSDTTAPIISIDNALIAPKQNMELPFVWEGVFWPRNSGWAILSVNQKTENSYIYRKRDWSAAKNYTKLKATESFITNQNKKGVKQAKMERSMTKDLSKWWFFVGFLVAISFLWYEHRFLANK